MRIIFLGTNGWYDTKVGNTTCILIETEDKYIILDAGNGLHKIDKHISTSKQIYLFLSHYHLDHIIGFHILAKFDFEQGIKVFGPPGLKKLLKDIFTKQYTMPIQDLTTIIEFNEIVDKNDIPLSIQFKRLIHSTICYGYRFFLEGKIVAYCTDTGICKNFLALAKNADLLITECSLRSGMHDKNWPHLNPETAAEAANNCKAKKLALIHFDANLYPNVDTRKEAELYANKIFQNSFVTYDDMELIL